MTKTRVLKCWIDSAVTLSCVSSTASCASVNPLPLVSHDLTFEKSKLSNRLKILVRDC